MTGEEMRAYSATFANHSTWSSNSAMLSAGMRITAGTWHDRMGRYGVAAATSHSHQP